MEQTVEEIPLEYLNDSPFQPRKTYRLIDELADSMKSVGVLQPLVVRVIAENMEGVTHYEIVAGHRRKRGAEKAGLGSVPCIVRDDLVTNEQVREAILIENSQRDDVPAIEEMDIFIELRDSDGLTPEDIAAKIGKPVGHVYRRLQLERLCPEGREALELGKLKLTVAERIAGLSDPETQEKAVSELSDTEYRSATLREAEEWIVRYGVMLLKNATFDIEDASLTDAPACGACEKNTAVSTMLFPELADDARCTSRSCFNEKLEASWNALVEKVQEDGTHTVLDEEATRKAFGNGYLHASWTDLDSTKYVQDAKGRSRPKSVRSVLGKSRIPETLYLARHPITKVPVHLVKTSDIKKKVQAEPSENDPFEYKSLAKHGSTKSKQELSAMRSKKISRQFFHLAMCGVQNFIESPSFQPWIEHEMLELLARGVVEKAWAATQSAAVGKRKIELVVVHKMGDGAEMRESNRDALIAYIDGDREGVPYGSNEARRATSADLEVLVMEILTRESTESMWDFSDEERVSGIGMFAQYGLDPIALQAEATTIIDEELKAKAEKLKKRAKKKKTKKAKKEATEPKSAKAAKDSPEAILEMHKGGMTYEQIGEELGLSKAQVSRILRKARETKEATD